MYGVDRGGGNRNSLARVQAVTQIRVGISDQYVSGGFLRNRGVNGGCVFEVIVVHQFLEAAVSARMRFNANQTALLSQRAGERQGFFPDARAYVDDYISGARRITPAEVSVRGFFHLRHMQANEWLMIGEEAPAGFMHPDSRIIEDAAYAFVLPSCELARAQRDGEPQ